MVAVTHNKAFADALQPTYVARVEGGEMKTRMVTGGALSKKDFSPNALATGGVAGEWRLFHSMFFLPRRNNKPLRRMRLAASLASYHVPTETTHDLLPPTASAIDSDRDVESRCVNVNA